jgi:hypothetical protein
MKTSLRPLSWLKAFFVEEFFGNRWIPILWFLIAVFVCVLYPLVLVVEFWNAPGGRTLEIFKLYPHMALVPPLLYWAIFWMIASSLSAAWTDKVLRPRIIWFAALSLVVSAVMTYRETTNSPIMLFELKPGRGNDNTWSTLYSTTRDMLKKPRQQFFSHEPTKEQVTTDGKPQSQLNPDEPTKEQVAMSQSLNYDYWRDKKRFSFSRAFYVATFFLSVFAVATVFAALSYFPNLSEEGKDRYLFQLLGAFFCYALWFPARFYYNLEIKSTLVGSSEKLPGGDLVLYFVGGGFLLFICIRMSKRLAGFGQIASLVALFLLPISSVFATKYLGNVFGPGSRPMNWVALFSAFIFFFIVFRGVLPPRDGASGSRKR